MLKKSLSVEAVRSTNITKTANDYNTTRKTVYHYKDKALNAINNAFSTQSHDDKVLYHLPITKDYIKMTIVSLHGIAKVSERDIQSVIECLFDYSISTGTINGVLNDISLKARAINSSYTHENCKHSASDECFHQGKPVLAVSDIPSKFCFLLELEDTLNEDVWTMHLQELKTKGYNPETNTMDGGTSMVAAYESTYPETMLKYDHFHIIKDFKEAIQCLKKKYDSATTKAIKAYGNYNISDMQYRQLRQDMCFYRDLYKTTKTLLDWMQYDVLQLAASMPSIRSELFDFIINELQKIAEDHPQRITAIITKLRNQKDKLLAVTNELNVRFSKVAIKYKVSLNDVWDICYLSRYSAKQDTYHIQAIDLETRLGEQFDCIEDEVLTCMKNTYRTSSVIENFYSRLRPYIDPRKGFKSKRYDLILFMLNHLRFKRSKHKEHVGKSAAELYTQSKLPTWIEMLGLQSFKRAA